MYVKMSHGIEMNNAVYWKKRSILCTPEVKYILRDLSFKLGRGSCTLS